MVNPRKMLLIDTDDERAEIISSVVLRENWDVKRANDLVEASDYLCNYIPDMIVINNDVSVEVKFFSKLNVHPLLKKVPVVVTARPDEKVKDPFLLYSYKVLDLPLQTSDLLKCMVENRSRSKLPPIEISDTEELTLECSAEILSINEFSCTVEAPIMVQANQNAELDAKILKEFGVNDKCKISNFNHESKTSLDKKQHYKTFFYFLGITEKVKTNIRKYQKK